MKNIRILLMPGNVIARSIALFVISSVVVQHSIAEQPDSTFQSLRILPRVFRAAEQTIRPTLVTIESFGGVSAVAGKIGGIRSRGEGNTTGVMISSDGYVVTSTFNFITRPPVITVITFDGKRHVAKLLGRDKIRKLCLLKIDDVADMPVPRWVPPEDVVVGQWSLSLGVGYGDLSPAVSIGIISAKNRVGGRAIQTDANVSPANYGGPLIDLEGRVIGICVPLSPGSQAVGAGVEWYDSGIGFAIPIAGADELIARLKNGETIEPAFLGIRSMANPRGKGVRIEEVLAGGAARDAGVRQGDVAVKFNGELIANPIELGAMISRHESGDKVMLAVEREGTDELLEIEVTLGSVPPPKGKPKPLEPPAIR
jgi:serine protease Do